MRSKHVIIVSLPKLEFAMEFCRVLCSDLYLLPLDNFRQHRIHFYTFADDALLNLFIQPDESCQLIVFGPWL